MRVSGTKLFASLGVSVMVPVTLLLSGSGLAPALGASATTISPLVPLEVVGPIFHSRVQKNAPSGPPSPVYCQATYGIACYGPPDMATEYNFPTSTSGGAGQTIVIFDSYGSPTIRQDLATFDEAYNISAPPSFKIYNPEGTTVLNYNGLPSPVNMNNKAIINKVGWAYETTLDVEYAHAMAPGANIALVTVPVAETQGVQGLQNLENAQLWALNHHLGNIWSDSFATTEQAFNSSASILGLDKLYAMAAADGVTVLFASGDSGVANTNKQGAPYPYTTVNYPSSSPNVLSVGGTEITNPPSTYITSYQSESVWNDAYGAGGGGFSSIFPVTPFQKSLVQANYLGEAARGLPDVSYNAAVISSVLIYESFDPVYGPGWVPIGGTSAATPQWAAVVATINQVDGAQGFIVPKLYALANKPSEYAQAFHDITSGNNSSGGITGYTALQGWDAASGLGTPNVSGLISALAPTGP